MTDGKSIPMNLNENRRLFFRKIQIILGAIFLFIFHVWLIVSLFDFLPKQWRFFDLLVQVPVIYLVLIIIFPIVYAILSSENPRKAVYKFASIFAPIFFGFVFITIIKQII